jgi:hypothetical protein
MNVLNEAESTSTILVQMLDGVLPDGMHECYADLASGRLNLRVQPAMVLVKYLPGAPSQRNRFLAVMNPHIDCKSLVGQILINDKIRPPTRISPEALMLIEQALENAQRAIDEYHENMDIDAS